MAAPVTDAQKSNNLWSDFCGQRAWKLVTFMEKWEFCMAITVWAKRSLWMGDNTEGKTDMYLMGSQWL